MTKKFEEFVSYSSLVSSSNNWGQKFTSRLSAKEFKESPTFDVLNIAYLISILKSLNKIKNLLERERIRK